MELGPQNHNKDVLLGPNSIIVVYRDPLGSLRTKWTLKGFKVLMHIGVHRIKV